MTTLIWLDLETTGLDPRFETILEIAAFKATLEQPFELSPLYEAVIHCEPSVKAGCDPLVRGMHTANGLWAECKKSLITLVEADIALTNRILTLRLGEEKAILAGSSIHFDHAFIKRHLVMTASHLSHRHYDVSAVKLFAQSLGMEKFAKAEAHRAAADVMESVAHAKAVAEWFEGNWNFQRDPRD